MSRQPSGRTAFSNTPIASIDQQHSTARNSAGPGLNSTYILAVFGRDQQRERIRYDLYFRRQMTRDLAIDLSVHLDVFRAGQLRFARAHYCDALHITVLVEDQTREILQIAKG